MFQPYKPTSHFVLFLFFVHWSWLVCLIFPTFSSSLCYNFLLSLCSPFVQSSPSLPQFISHVLLASGSADQKSEASPLGPSSLQMFAGCTPKTTHISPPQSMPSYSLLTSSFPGTLQPCFCKCVFICRRLLTVSCFTTPLTPWHRCDLEVETMHHSLIP